MPVVARLEDLPQFESYEEENAFWNEPACFAAVPLSGYSVFCASVRFTVWKRRASWTSSETATSRELMTLSP